MVKARFEFQAVVLLCKLKQDRAKLSFSVLTIKTQKKIGSFYSPGSKSINISLF